ncbi:MAG: MFS transporter [Gammaproteobacteria bacterium]|nr:MFS transporter [Gammaproteobacteria bacterium]MBU1625105.1 MFS transporter [Gammaproteobacteria bacterium]MBU1981365.1 MFS transporter [Gammaproteobacteria bacterium]
MTQPVRSERALLLTLAAIQFSHILDFMIMMPLGPMLMNELGITTHEFGLLVASYSFSAAFSGLFAATFVDRFERKRFLLVIFVLFGLATLACAIAPSYASLLVARGLAGAFGGVLGALVQTIVGDTIPFARRAKASGTIAAAFSFSTVAGVPLSLWLASLFHWRAPFVFIVTLVAIFLLIAHRVLPELRHHLNQEKRAHPFIDLFAVMRDPNHWRAMTLTAMIIFSGFTVIPYITVYAVNNIGISQHDIAYIYLVGGAATLFTARAIGHWADAAGKVQVYRIVAFCAMLPILLVTQVEHASLNLFLVFTTLFFVLVSGRFIPAMAIITSAAQPKLRGTFMSLNATVQSLAMGLAATLSGFIITQDASGQIVGYGNVGYVAIGANLLAMGFVSRIVMHDAHPNLPDVVPK